MHDLDSNLTNKYKMVNGNRLLLANCVPRLRDTSDFKRRHFLFSDLDTEKGYGSEGIIACEFGGRTHEYHWRNVTAFSL